MLMMPGKDESGQSLRRHDGNGSGSHDALDDGFPHLAIIDKSETRHFHVLIIWYLISNQLVDIRPDFLN